ncbi:peptidoglycan-binding domain-containing protein [Microcystis aeruginosa CS-564/01]|uniref:peptidoglycan-binding domain-containing protein n=1 Tax=Microcystis aeruginosa TaxID=1126 RepID=UPI00232B7222|nr:peptidoglycan-binding domain-containing protein [Microcystis aeruginosa]MDB9426660.1 peptidoglycan-binding domain-containing protein [Microcystis aeruginosa CS-564/01]
MGTTYNFDRLLELESDYFDDSLADELEQVIDEILDDFEDVDQFLPASQMSRAVQRNQVLSGQLGWQSHYDAIVRLLAATGCLRPNYSPGWQDLSEAIACWQQRQGLTADGIIGRNTWGRMQTALRLQPSPSEAISSLTAESPRGPFGTLTVSTSGFPIFSYPFTSEDVLWTARFIVGEAGGRADLDNQAVIWAMFNRYALFTHRNFPTFHQFLRAYSTPLQPVLKNPGAAGRHMHKSSFVRTGGYYPRPNDHIPRGQLQKHCQLQRTPWNQLFQSARSLAERAMKGLIPNPIGNASEFASTRIYFRDQYGRYPNQTEWERFTREYPSRSKKNWQWIGPVPNLDQMKNAFFIDKRAINLPADAIRVVSPIPED